ncbi:MAG: nuclease-related domain-containing protein [Woeseia sp.]
MTCYADFRSRQAYAMTMPSRTFQYLTVAATLLGLPLTVSANLPGEAETGLQGSGFTLALLCTGMAIVLALLIRNRAAPLMHSVNRWLGGRRVQAAIRQCGFERLSNFILPGSCDGLNRIDHAVLTSGAIICIRAKSCNGVVFGSARDPQWTNVDGVEHQKFLNPLIQNAGRVRTLQEIVGDMPVVNLVVFSGDVQVPVAPAENVIHVSALQTWLEQFQKNSHCAQDPEAAWLSLRAAARTDAASRKDFESQLSFG